MSFVVGQGLTWLVEGKLGNVFVVLAIADHKGAAVLERDGRSDQIKGAGTDALALTGQVFP